MISYLEKGVGNQGIPMQVYISICFGYASSWEKFRNKNIDVYIFWKILPKKESLKKSL